MRHSQAPTTDTDEAQKPVVHRVLSIFFELLAGQLPVSDDGWDGKPEPVAPDQGLAPGDVIVDGWTRLASCLRWNDNKHAGVSRP